MGPKDEGDLGGLESSSGDVPGLGLLSFAHVPLKNTCIKSYGYQHLSYQLSPCILQENFEAVV